MPAVVRNGWCMRTHRSPTRQQPSTSVHRRQGDREEQGRAGRLVKGAASVSPTIDGGGHDGIASLQSPDEEPSMKVFRLHARVTATAGAGNPDFVRGLGADDMIGYVWNVLTVPSEAKYDTMNTCKSVSAKGGT